MPIFKSKYDFQKLIPTFCYYQNSFPPIKFSKFTTLAFEEKKALTKKLASQKDFLVEIITFVLMPNHFHLLLKQLKDNGIVDFVRRACDSYSHYFNIKTKRKGGLFEGRFKAIRVESEPQLLHLSRYIHLNPYSSFLVKDFKSLKNYPFSSLPEYLGLSEKNICQKEIILNQFKNPKEYEKFIFDQADHQRNLEVIKHQLLETQ